MYVRARAQGGSILSGDTGPNIVVHRLANVVWEPRPVHWFEQRLYGHCQGWGTVSSMLEDFGLEGGYGAGRRHGGVFCMSQSLTLALVLVPFLPFSLSLSLFVSLPL